MEWWGRDSFDLCGMGGVGYVIGGMEVKIGEKEEVVVKGGRMSKG